MNKRLQFGARPILSAGKNLHLCRVGAFENPQLTDGSLSSGFWIPLLWVGLQAPEGSVGSRGDSIGSSKESPDSRTPQRFVPPFPAAQWDCSTRRARLQERDAAIGRTTSGVYNQRKAARLFRPRRRGQVT